MLHIVREKTLPFLTSSSWTWSPIENSRSIMFSSYLKLMYLLSASWYEFDFSTSKTLYSNCFHSIKHILISFQQHSTRTKFTAMLTDHSKTIIIVNGILPSLAVLAVILRLHARRLKHLSLRADDYTILGALVKRICVSIIGWSWYQRRLWRLEHACHSFTVFLRVNQCEHIHSWLLTQVQYAVEWEVTSRTLPMMNWLYLVKFVNTNFCLDMISLSPSWV